MKFFGDPQFPWMRIFHFGLDKKIPGIADFFGIGIFWGLGFSGMGIFFRWMGYPTKKPPLVVSC